MFEVPLSRINLSCAAPCGSLVPGIEIYLFRLHLISSAFSSRVTMETHSLVNFLLIPSIKKEQKFCHKIQLFGIFMEALKRGLSFCELKKAKTQLIRLHALLKISSHSLESFTSFHVSARLRIPFD